MVRQGILKAREKLIDLSLRNGMLNYRHSESSGCHEKSGAAMRRMIPEWMLGRDKSFIEALEDAGVAAVVALRYGEPTVSYRVDVS
jgi:hypothetical protein